MEIQWSLVLFTAISGTGSCLFAIAVLQHLLGKGELPTRAESIVSFVLLAVGGALSATHIIYHLDRIVEALNHPTSGIFIEAMGVAIMCLIIFVYFLLMWRGVSKTACTVVAVIGMVVGVVFAFECGNSYFMESRPAWTTHLLPGAYCATAIASGAALNILMKNLAKRDEATVSCAGLLAVVGGVLGVVLSAAFCIQAAGYYADAESGAVAWTVLQCVALLLGIACGVVAWKKTASCKRAVCILALAASFVGAVSMRVVMWLLGTQVLNFFLMPME